MRRSLTRILFIIGGAAGLLALVALAVPSFVVDRDKPRWEAAASDALGMDVRIAGRLGMSLLSGVRITASDVRILDEGGVTVASAKRVRVWVDPLPLLRGQVRLSRVELAQPMLSIVRDADGRSNVGKLKRAVSLLGTLEGGHVSLSDGTLRYSDAKSDSVIDAAGLDLDVSRIRFAGGKRPRSAKDVSFHAQLACREIRARGMSVTALALVANGNDGVFEVTPVTLRVFGGRMDGSLRVDLASAVPACRLRCSLPHFRIEDFLATLSPNRGAEGAMDFSMSLTMQGGTKSQMLQTAAGVMSLRGHELRIVGTDLDRSIARFKTSQNFNLVDVGAVFFAGPVGLAVTKGYNFASLFRGVRGNSTIGTLVSDWTVERGIAEARDVALSTARNRIALQGRLDFVHERFADVIMAVVDTKGCATQQQEIRGTFAKPVVEKPRAIASIAGPLIKLYQRTRAMFPAAPCAFSYSGSVPPPG